MGNESDHYDGLRKRFAGMAESDEEPIASVGRAGVEVFTAEAEKARQKERRARILGWE